MKTNRIIIPAIILVFGFGLRGQEKKHFLEPAEIIKIMEASKTEYRLEDGFDKLKPEERQDLVQALFPVTCAHLENPQAIRQDGRTILREFSFSQKAVEFIEEGETFFGKKDYDAARMRYERALQADPNCYLAVAYIGDCLNFSGQLEKALVEYDRAILMNPLDHRLHYFRGNASLKLGRVEEAKTSYLRSLALRPRYEFVLKVLPMIKEVVKVSVRDSLFHPYVFVRKEGEVVGVYVDLEKGGPAWLAYANAKAVWLGEESHRRDMTGSTEYKWSVIEEQECLANLLAVYASALEKKQIKPDSELETLKKIFDNGDLDLFILYEIYTRLCPYGMLVQTPEVRERMVQYLKNYMFVSL